MNDLNNLVNSKELEQNYDYENNDAIYKKLYNCFSFSQKLKN